MAGTNTLWPPIERVGILKKKTKSSWETFLFEPTKWKLLFWGKPPALKIGFPYVFQFKIEFKGFGC